MIFIYNVFFPLVFIFFVPVMLFKLIRRSGRKSNYGERFGIFSAAKKAEFEKLKNPIWVHAVSVGETAIALEMIRKWRKKSPQTDFVLSTTTTTGQALAAKNAPGNVSVIFCPLDFSPAVKKTLKLIDPAMIVIFETEIWPNLLHQAKKRKIKLALVNGRMSDNSSKGYYRWRIFFAPLLEKFDVICVQSEIDRQRYSAVSPRANVVITGNMKFDQVVPEKLRQIELDGYFGKEKTLIMLGASTHSGEEKILAKVFKSLQGKFPKLKMILVPRHAERAEEIIRELKKLEISFCQRSQNEECLCDCLLADTTGEMLSFMDISDVVFMGKSLAGHDEGHNLIEPAVMKKPIVTGSVLKNFREVLNILKEKHALILVDNRTELENALFILFKDAKRRQELGISAARALAEHRGATVENIKILEELI